MGDARSVRGSESFGDLRADVEHLPQRQLSPAQRGALHQLHHHVAIADVVDAEDIGVIERCQQAGFLLEACPPRRVVRRGPRAKPSAQHRVRAAYRERGRPRPCRQRPTARRFRKVRDEYQDSRSLVAIDPLIH